MNFNLNGRLIGEDCPTYFIADIAANHDGSLKRAIDLIKRAKDAGADAAKFQHFKAETIVSDRGFKTLKGVNTHQDKWRKSVFQVYEAASINNEWNSKLLEECKKVNIDFFTSPYDPSLVDIIDEFVPAYKVGSGDIDWLEILDKIGKKNKPVIIATGASRLEEIKTAVNTISKHHDAIALLQCNTNYTGSRKNFNYINLNVLLQFRRVFPEMVIGLSDHTPGHTTAVGSVALGGKIIEKHFTDDKNRTGPDHRFSMNPRNWRAMVLAVRELEKSLGSGIKRIEQNEIDSFKVQRRSIRAKKQLSKGTVLKRSYLEILRPRSENGLSPTFIEKIVSRTLTTNIEKGDEITWKSVGL